MKKKVLPCFVLPLVLVGCSGLSKEQNEQVNNMSDCEKVTTLTQIADEGFKPLRGAEVSSKFMTSWNAKIQLVGDNCKIIETNEGAQQYMCSAQYKTQEEAQQIHDQAKSLTQRCLGKQWATTTSQAQRSLTTTMSAPEESARVLLTLGKGYDKRKPWIVSFKVVDG